MQMNEEWEDLVEKIRLKADTIYNTFKSLFAPPPVGTKFAVFFEAHVVDFRNATKNMDRDKVLHMVTDPSTA
jgi:hypothetical protein